MSSAPGPYTVEGIRWADRPRASRGEHLPVCVIVPQKEHLFRVLCHHVEGVEVHYDGDRTGPCTADKGECWFPHGLVKLRRQGWLHVWNFGAKEQQLVCLTEKAWGCIDAVSAAAESIRGGTLKVWRKGRSHRGRMFAELDLEGGRVDGQFPPAIDLRAHLTKMWSSPLKKPGAQAARERKYAELNGQAPPPATPFRDVEDEIPV